MSAGIPENIQVGGHSRDLYMGEWLSEGLRRAREETRPRRGVT